MKQPCPLSALLLLLLLLGFEKSACGLNSFSDPSYFDSLREEGSGRLHDVSVSPDSNIFLVDLVPEEDGTPGPQYRLAELKTFLPLSNGGTHIRNGTQDDAAAALLAMHHFNNIEMSPILTPEDIEGCNVKITMEIVDSKFSPIG